MCCTGSIEETKKFLSKHRNHKKVTVYKVLKYNMAQIYSPYQYTPYEPGIIYSDYLNSRIKCDISVSTGIHVWLDKKTAESHAKRRGGKVAVMTAEVKDLIAVGYFHDYKGLNAVFNKVKFSNSEYDKFIKAYKRKLSRQK